MRVLRPLILTLLVVSSPIVARADSGHAHEAPDPADRSWLSGLTLVTTSDTDIATVHAARVAIQLQGGRVGLFTPAGMLMAWIPPELDTALLAEESIASIDRQPVDDFTVAKASPQGLYFARSFNAFVSGDFERQIREEIARKGPPEPPADRPSDALAPPAFEPEAYRENLVANGLDLAQLEARGLLDDGANKGNLSIMSGTISATIFMNESDGSGSDPDIYTWSEEDVQDYINGSNSGLLFWSERASAYGCWAAFMVRYMPPTDPRCETPYEPIINSSNVVSSIVSTIMNQFGYTSGSQFSKVSAYNTWQCATYGVDRAYSAFVGYNPIPSGDQFSNGSAAWAYLFGPYTWLLFRSHSWAPDQVFTHETGHIFGACDEYASSGCGCTDFCSNGVALGNCENCAGFAACMMASNTFTLCQFTDGHVGWRNNPCSPPPLPGPTVTSVSPSSAQVGTTTDITVTGQDFFLGTFLDMGEDVTVDWTEFVDETTVIVTITIDDLATPGLRDVEVVNRDLQSDTLGLGFDVIATPRHYMSAGGSNTYPYLTPADAANTLAAALSAAGPGDSVLVDIAPISGVQLNVTQNVGIFGGWTNNFQTRNPTDRTDVTLQSNLKIQNQVTLDGLELHSGIGLQESTPVSGFFGGAITVRNGGDLTVRNCDIHDNSADNASGDGGGGAIYVYQSTLNLLDSTISGNTTQNGGALYFRESSGTVSGTTISGNTVTHPVDPSNGGAVYVVDSSNLLFEDNIIDLHSGADSGGAFYVENSTGITVRGGTISGSTAGFAGGGLALIGSDATVENVTFDTNAATVQGGAIYVDAASSLTASGNTFRGNSAQLGAGIHQTTTPLAVTHNIFDGNTAQFTGSALFANSVPSGDVLGNTFHGNVTLIGGGATVALSASTPTVQHNIFSAASHVGLFCSGGGSPAGYNLFHANAEADVSGCTLAPTSLTGDPLFVDPVGGDFHLGLDSPAIDAAEALPAFDDPDGSRGDLGAFGTHTFVMDQPSFPQNVVVNVVGSDVNVSWDANPAADLASYAVYGGPASGFVPSAANRLALVTAPTTAVNLGPQPGVTHVRVSAVDTDGYAGGYSLEAEVDSQTATDPPEAFVTRLFGNIPNPFNPSTEIRYEVASAGHVDLLVYDVTGRVVRRLVAGHREAGRHQAGWDGRDHSGARVASGVYFSKLLTQGQSHTQKMILLK